MINRINEYGRRLSAWIMVDLMNHAVIAMTNQHSDLPSAFWDECSWENKWMIEPVIYDGATRY
jgi:hypothetical protein